MIGFTFDQEVNRVYCDGVLDENANSNPFRWQKPIFDGGSDGSDFTVAQRALPKWPGYPAVEAPTHGEGFGGVLGGLAVFPVLLFLFWAELAGRKRKVRR